MGLYAKMVQVMGEIGQLQKDGSVTDRSGRKMYDYLSEEQTTSELQKALIKHGLVIFPIEIEDKFFYVEGQTSSGTYKTPISEVKVRYKIVDAETGETDIIVGKGQGSDNGDKASNKAMTGAYKYMMRHSFAVSTGDDGDHDASDPIIQRSEQKGPQKAPQGRAGSSELLNKVSQQAAKIEAESEQLKKIKQLWQEGAGSLDGFEEWHASMKTKGISEKRMLEFMQEKMKDKQKQVQPA